MVDENMAIDNLTTETSKDKILNSQLQMKQL